MYLNKCILCIMSTKFSDITKTLNLVHTFNSVNKAIIELHRYLFQRELNPFM